MLACVDDGANVFNSRSDLVIRYEIVYDIIAKWGFTAHAGNEGKKYKTETMIFPSTSILK